VSVVENDPRMMVLRYIGGLAPIKPLDSMSQGDHCSTWTGRYQGSRPPARDPLETHQQRQLPLHSFGQAQRVIDEAQHCDGGLLLAFARSPVAAIGWIRDEGSAAIGYNLARQEVYPRRAKAVISDIRGRYAVAMALQHSRNGAGTAARLPYSPPKLHMMKQRLGDPIWGRVEVVHVAIIAGDMDGAARSAPENSSGFGCTCLRYVARGKQVTHGLGWLHQIFTGARAELLSCGDCRAGLTVFLIRYQ
jgi:hypothetical protein